MLKLVCYILLYRVQRLLMLDGDSSILLDVMKVLCHITHLGLIVSMSPTVL